jgi:hypothetical protein
MMNTDNINMLNLLMHLSSSTFRLDVPAPSTIPEFVMEDGTSPYAEEHRIRRNRQARSWPNWRCVECNTHNTPERRKGPKGDKSLCNRCGIRWSKFLKWKESLKRKQFDESVQQRMSIETLLNK